MKNPSAAGGEVTLNPTFDALSLDYSAIARAMRDFQMALLRTMPL